MKTGVRAAAECAERLDLISHPVRLAVVRALGKASLTVTDLLREIPVEQNLMSHHLRVLRDGGLVVAARDQKSRRYSLAPGVSAEDADAINVGCCKVTFPPSAA